MVRGLLAGLAWGAGAASGSRRPRPPVTVVETLDVRAPAGPRCRDLDDLAVGEGTHPVHDPGGQQDLLAGFEGQRLQVALVGAVLHGDTTRLHGECLLLEQVALQGERSAGPDVEHLAHVAPLEDGEDLLVAPWLLDADPGLGLARGGR